MKAEEKRWGEVDTLRGLAIIAMVLGHSFIKYPVDISGVAWCAAIQQVIYTFHMEILFFLAGMVYHCEAYAPYIKKKVKRILIPYICFGFLTVFAKAFGGAAVHNGNSLGGVLLA